MIGGVAVTVMRPAEGKAIAPLPGGSMVWTVSCRSFQMLMVLV